MSQLADKQVQPTGQSGRAERFVHERRRDSAITRSRWPYRKRRSTTTMVAVIIAIGNLLALATLPWTQASLFGDTNPAIWLALGLLLPISLISISIYRDYWKTKEADDNKFETLGPYILKQKLGAGGMGEVYLAEHALMKRQCAIKLIHPERARDRDVQNSFAREAQATAQLTHWNTIEVYDYGTSEDGRFYYVMEYLEGVNLWQYVREYGPMDPRRVVYLLKQLCDALYEAECSGLVHRDIKPSNIFLTERGRSFDVAKLLDFGLVQTITDQPVKIRNSTTRLHGSPAFMCPEQAVGMAPDCRGDLYSLGAVAYFLLTGRPPFQDDNPIMLVVAHATSTVPTFEEIGANVPEQLGQIVLRCLSRDPSARYASARELLEVLESCDMGHAWTWRDAEAWWAQYSPRCADVVDNDTIDVTATVEFDRTECQIRIPAGTEKTLLNHELPTGVLETSAELVEA